MRKGWLLMAGGVLVAAMAAAQPACEQDAVFTSGTDGYHTYRIPALAVANDGTVLAFCEGRKRGGGDSGDIDLLLKRSTDGGRTWSAPQVVWDDAENTCGNPAPVVDRATGTVWLLLTWNRGDDREPYIINRTSRDTRRVFVTHSADHGLSWAKPVEITSDVKKPDWTWYATGPCGGMQIERGPHKGRLVIPCDHIEAESKNYYSHAIYSDDHGATWRLGNATPEHRVNECAVVELADGRLMLNMRNYDPEKRNRQVAFSSDGGHTWGEQHFDLTLVEPICQASLRRHSWPTDDKAGAILFSNPASSEKRVNMTVRVSRDDGVTWPESKTLHGGPSAYSDLAVLGDGTILCFYEAGLENPYETIRLARFPIEWIAAP